MSVQLIATEAYVRIFVFYLRFYTEPSATPQSINFENPLIIVVSKRLLGVVCNHSVAQLQAHHIRPCGTQCVFR